MSGALSPHILMKRAMIWTVEKVAVKESVCVLKVWDVLARWLCCLEGVGRGAGELGRWRRAYAVDSHVLFDGGEGFLQSESFSKGHGGEGLIGGFDLCLDGGDAERHVCEWVLSFWDRSWTGL